MSPVSIDPIVVRMTLILTLVSRHFVLQVSDRMVSKGGVPIRPASNKTVVFLARDGMATASYTGLAEVNGIATDDWIARRAAGVADWGAQPVAWIMKGKRPRWPDIGTVARSIADDLTMALAGYTSVEAKSLLQVVLAGWQWKRSGSHARPVLWQITRDETGSFKAISKYPRHEYRSRFMFAAVPMWPQADLAELRGQLAAGKASDRAGARDLLVETVRAVSKSQPGTVGPHCMSVLLYPPEGEVTFIPHELDTGPRPLPSPFDDPRLGTTLFVRPVDPGDPLRVAPANAVYNPWLIVGDDLVVAPSLVSGTTDPFIYSRGQFKFSVSGRPARGGV